MFGRGEITVSFDWVEGDSRLCSWTHTTHPRLIENSHDSPTTQSIPWKLIFPVISPCVCPWEFVRPWSSQINRINAMRNLMIWIGTEFICWISWRQHVHSSLRCRWMFKILTHFDASQNNLRTLSRSGEVRVSHAREQKKTKTENGPINLFRFGMSPPNLHTIPLRLHLYCATDLVARCPCVVKFRVIKGERKKECATVGV